MAKKFREKHWFLKVVICIICSILAIYFSINMISDVDDIEKNYDYSNVYSLTGEIIDTYWDDDFALDKYRFTDSANIVIKLENDEVVKIDLGGELNYKEGDTVVVYTDGINYSLSEGGIALENNPISIVYFIIASLFMFLMIIVWTAAFSWKGLIIGFLIMSGTLV